MCLDIVSIQIIVYVTKNGFVTKVDEMKGIKIITKIDFLWNIIYKTILRIDTVDIL